MNTNKRNGNKRECEIDRARPGERERETKNYIQRISKSFSKLKCMFENDKRKECA